MPRRSNFGDSQSYEKREKCEKKACFSFHFRVQSKFDKVKVTNYHISDSF
jgi:hypothetical protein